MQSANLGPSGSTAEISNKIIRTSVGGKDDTSRLLGKRLFGASSLPAPLPSLKDAEAPRGLGAGKDHGLFCDQTPTTNKASRYHLIQLQRLFRAGGQAHTLQRMREEIADFRLEDGGR